VRESGENKMVNGENGTMGRGRHRRASQKSALAEKLGHDGGPQTPKSATGAAGGPSGKQTTTQNLILKVHRDGGGSAAEAGGARDAGVTRCSPVGGARAATDRRRRGRGSDWRGVNTVQQRERRRAYDLHAQQARGGGF
jgi:hypothetical protein